VPVLSDVVTFLSSVVALSPYGQFWLVHFSEQHASKPQCLRNAKFLTTNWLNVMCAHMLAVFMWMLLSTIDVFMYLY
jgi:hypothetical protein